MSMPMSSSLASPDENGMDTLMGTTLFSRLPQCQTLSDRQTLSVSLALSTNSHFPRTKRNSQQLASPTIKLLIFCRWLAWGITTEDVKANCNDLKVLGKGDFKTLIKWRLALREEVGITSNRNQIFIVFQLGLDAENTLIEEPAETVQVTDGMDDEHQIQEEVSINSN